MDRNDHIAIAEGYLDLGMPVDAWLAMSDVTHAQSDPVCMEVRLRILTAMGGMWMLGREVAGVVERSTVEPEKCRQTVARFYHAYARNLSIDGHDEESRAAVRAAVSAWPGIRMEIVEDPDIDLGR